MAKKNLDSRDEVVEALGGLPNIRSLTGANYKQSQNWKDGFPSRYFLVMTTALRRRGLEADPELWGMVTQQRRAS